MANKKEPSFEEAMRNLEMVLEQMEEENQDLEQMLHLYEEGIRISEYCRKRLETARQKVEEMEPGK